MSGQRNECVRGGELTQVALIQCRAPREIIDGIKTAGRACSNDPIRGLLCKAAHHGKTKAHRRFAVSARLECRHPCAHHDIDRPHFDVMTARILHELRRRIKSHRLAVEQRG